ncbi:cytochrome c biogenesis protein ResB [Synechococcus sp. M16CYN]|uniref:cytochrome c biogenesis protein ResB n=1 Tax=Synechococcus sp. M16CYN TaxID=3103139 RepID=UPI00324DAED1
MGRFVAWLSDLRVAIVLLLLIALSSAIGTAIPQGDAPRSYIEAYTDTPWLGLLHGEQVLQLQLDHIYSSVWFLALLTWLGLTLILCSWRRQWPALQAARTWIDYHTPRQLSKLTIAESLSCADPSSALHSLSTTLSRRGWLMQSTGNRFAARKGTAGRVGPLLVHTGLILLMLGATWGVLAGKRLEKFLAPGRTLNLLNRTGEVQVSILLEAFQVDRDPTGRPEQFRSRLHLEENGAALEYEISVNHPLRHRGITIYQADWSLAAITLQIGRSPQLQLPLRNFPELGNQIWGLILPAWKDGDGPIFLSIENEQGPINIFDTDGTLLTLLWPGGPSVNVKGLPIRVSSILPASGLLLKRDPGVPLVYLGFAVMIVGGGLSLIATRQIWAIASDGQLHVGGLCNRNLAAFANEIPNLLKETALANQQG